MQIRMLATGAKKNSNSNSEDMSAVHSRRLYIIGHLLSSLQAVIIYLKFDFFSEIFINCRMLNYQLRPLFKISRCYEVCVSSKFQKEKKNYIWPLKYLIRITAKLSQTTQHTHNLNPFMSRQCYIKFGLVHPDKV